jgi:acid stress-induced BolA-like protein IbaG/YrbA
VDKNLIEDIILKQIPDAKCYFDGDTCNLKLVVISEVFKDLSLIEQHKLVLNSLKDKFESGSLHALSLETKAG